MQCYNNFGIDRKNSEYFLVNLLIDYVRKYFLFIRFSHETRQIAVFIIHGLFCIGKQCIELVIYKQMNNEFTTTLKFNVLRKLIKIVNYKVN